MSANSDRVETRQTPTEHPSSGRLSQQNGLGSLTCHDIRDLNQTGPDGHHPHLPQVGFTDSASGPAPLIYAKDPVDALPVTEFGAAAERLFPRIDRNHDNILTADELAAAVTDRHYTGRDAQVVSALYEQRAQIRNLQDNLLDGVPFYDFDMMRDDLRRFTEISHQPKLRGGDAELVNTVAGQMQRTAQGQIGASPTEPLYVTNSGNQLDAIRPDAIQQGVIGDCYLVASIAAQAEANPASIQRMIRDNGNNTFTVTFPGDPGHPVTVSRPTEAEMGLYNGHSSRGIWPNVLEKAAGQYMQTHYPLLHGGHTPAEGADGGGWPALVMNLLSGRPADTHLLPVTTHDAIRRDLTEAFNQGRPVVVCATGLPIGDPRTRDGLPSRHAYSVIGWNPNGPNGGTVTVRNPWGNSGSDKDGRSSMSVDDFRANFTYMFIQDRRS